MFYFIEFWTKVATTHLQTLTTRNHYLALDTSQIFTTGLIIITIVAICPPTELSEQDKYLIIYYNWKFDQNKLNIASIQLSHNTLKCNKCTIA